MSPTPPDSTPRETDDERDETMSSLFGDVVRRDVSLSSLTTYRLGGRARYFVAAEHEGHLEMAREARQLTGLDVFVLGRGSNVLVADSGFDGLVVTLSGSFGEMSFSENTVRAGAAVSLPVLARKTASCGFTGMEWAVGVPGSVGGAIRMNAGGHGSSISERLTRYRVLDLSGDSDGTFDASQLGLSYRSSNLTPTQIVEWGEFRLELGNVEAAEELIRDIVKWRRTHQPGGHNAGSVFANPKGDSAGRLIESVGLRGFRIGSAAVSEKHANFIQSDSTGTASDVVAVMRHVRNVVREQTGIALRLEVRLIGFPPDIVAELSQ